MSQGLEQYKDVIEQLKPAINQPDFNRLLERVAADLPKSKRFLIKMELKRQARPCSRPIDLRGHVNGECHPFEYDGVTHYLDDIAKEVFERQVRAFGSYTLGVFEAATNTENNFRVMYQKAKQNPTDTDTDQTPSTPPATPQGRSHQCPLIRFRGAVQRSEERMNFSVPVEITTANNEILKGITVDLSVQGLKLKLPAPNQVAAGESVFIHFTGLESEFHLDSKLKVEYRVLQIVKGEEWTITFLKRPENSSLPKFDEFLEPFIHGNKRRYKINLENTLDAVMEKGYQQYYLPNTRSVPVFLARTEQGLCPQFVLSNNSNNDTLYYWTDESHRQRLGYLFAHDRIAAVTERPANQRYTYLYCFTHVSDEKTYYYSASEEELNAAPELKSVFLSYGAQKASWRVYKLQLTPINPEQANLPLSLPAKLRDKVKRQNQPVSARLQAKIKHLAYVAYLTDITHEKAVSCYQRMQLEPALLRNLSRFAHSRTDAPPAIACHRFRFQNLRKEDRYQLRASIELSYGDATYFGHTEDFSPSGLSIQLDSPFPLKAGSRIRVSMPGLQKLTETHSLDSLPYQVVFVSNSQMVIGLNAITHERNKDAQRFFHQLIRNNKNKLKVNQSEEDPPGIGQALRNMCANNIANMALFLKKDGINIVADAFLGAHQPTPIELLLQRFCPEGQLSAYSLFGATGKYHNFLPKLLKTLRPNDPPRFHELYVMVRHQEVNIKTAIKSFYCPQFESDAERRQFIVQAMREGSFFAIGMFLNRTGRPDTEQLQTELSYVSTYALHRSKAIEEHLWNIQGMVDLMDITDIVMDRLGFSHEHIDFNAIAQQRVAHLPRRLDQTE